MQNETRSAKPRKLIWFASILAITLVLFVGFRPDRAIRVATGVVAHDLCSKTFISGLDPQTVTSAYVMAAASMLSCIAGLRPRSRSASGRGGMSSTNA
jgi:hypothetical protein